MNFFAKIETVITAPELFFHRLRKEPFSGSVIYYLIFVLVTGVIETIYILKEFNITFSWYPLIYLGVIFFSLLLLFIWTGLMHLGIKMMGGKGKYGDTFRSDVYGSTPSLLWGIPSLALSVLLFQNTAWEIIDFIVTLVIAIYSFLLTLIGLSLYHNLSKSKAFIGAILLPLLALFAFIIVMGLLLFFIMILIGGKI